MTDSEPMVVQDGRDDLPFIVHSELDDIGLDPFEFRVYAHIVRRAGKPNQKGEFYEGAPKSAKHCRMDLKTYRRALRSLVALRLVTREDKPGLPSVYRVTPQRVWRPRPDTAGVPETVGVANPAPLPETDRTPTGNGRTPLPETVDKGSPTKGVQRRESQKGAREKFDPLTVELPENVTASTWRDFIAYRRERRLPVTPTHTRRLLERLSAAGADADAMLVQTIENGWQGVFDLKDKPALARPNNPALRAAEQATSLLAHLEGRRAS